MFSKHFIFGFLFTALILRCYSTEDRPVVQVKGSKVFGINSEAAFKNATRKAKLFLGIPYSKPPLGELRFKKPEPLPTLPPLVMATEFKSGCLQAPRELTDLPEFTPEKQSEDCLYLNVFVPDSKPDKHEGHAVMIFIHGGGFFFGSGDYVVKYLSTYGNVILVSINYRLGVFGFLGTGDKHGPGNLGLWDQHLAIQWVHENIASFGGDNKRVTIFGESAGSISVMHQALYPQNKGLFQRVIAQSGAPSMKLLFHHQVMRVAKYYAEAFGCEKEDSRGIIECLQSKPAESIISIQNQQLQKGTPIDKLYVFPYFDNDFIKLDPLNVFDAVESVKTNVENFYRSLDIIHGVNSAEGIIMYNHQYVPIIDDPSTFRPTRQQMDEEAIRAVVNTHYGQLNEPLLEVVSSMYTDWSNPDCPETLAHQLLKLIGDLMFVIPAVQYVRLHVNISDDVNSYLYYLNAVPTKPLLPRLSWARGADHGDDLNFVFNFRVVEDKEVSPADWEYDLSLEVMTYWSNFAKTGNPNKPEAVKTKWPKYNMEKQMYLQIVKDMSNENVKEYFYAEEAEFWLKTIPNLQTHMATKPFREYWRSVNKTCSSDGECQKP